MAVAVHFFTVSFWSMGRVKSTFLPDNWKMWTPGKAGYTSKCLLNSDIFQELHDMLRTKMLILDYFRLLLFVKVRINSQQNGPLTEFKVLRIKTFN